MKHYCYYSAPIGDLLLVEENGKLEQLLFPNHHREKGPDSEWVLDEKPFKDVIKQLQDYFAQKRRTFSIDLNLIGTEFQKRVWQELTKIPFGTTTNYGELAVKIGNPKASRAVGMANGKNPVPIVVPCHRVIGKDGSLTGFGGGLDIKRHLLHLESVDA